MNETSNSNINIKIETVMRVYSGKAHSCMCGCNGTYKVASAHRAAADTDRGYPHDDKDVSDRSVALVVGKISKAIASGTLPEVCSDYIAVDVGTRTYVAYFAPQVIH